VWSQQMASGAVTCGAMLLHNDRGDMHAWRGVVDSVAYSG
jgi:hypothetical protein